MFENWLKDHPAERAAYNTPIFPPAKDRAFWADKAEAALVKSAEEYLDYTWPQALASDFMAYRRESNRLKQEKPHFARRTALSTLIVGEICEYKGRFLQDIVNGIFAICEETYWGVSAHYPYDDAVGLIPDAENCYIDLFAAETAALLASAWQLLYDELYAFCPEILRRVEYEMDRRIIRPYLTHRDFWWMGYIRTVNNWNPWVLSNVLHVFLAMEKRDSVFREGMQKMFHEIDAYYLEHPMDGGCDEGASYWTVAGGMLFEFCELLYRATDGNVNFFTDEKMRNVAKYMYRAYIGNGYFVNFADGPCRIMLPLEGFLYAFGLRTEDPDLMAFSRIFAEHDDGRAPEFRRDAKIRRALYSVIYRRDILSQPDFVPLRECRLDSVQNSFLRNGDWFCAAKGGHNAESHNHNDVGSFLVYHKDAPVLADPGCGTYTAKTFSPQRYEIWTMQSSWHNLPEVNGCAQLPGQAFCADGFAFDGCTTDLSFASAYGKEAGLSEVKRHLTFAEDGPVWEDSFVFTGEKNHVSEHFVTPLEVTVEDGKAVLGGMFVIEADAPMTVTADYVSFEGDHKLTDNWGVQGMHRVKFDFDAEKQAKVCFTLKRR